MGGGGEGASPRFSTRSTIEFNKYEKIEGCEQSGNLGIVRIRKSIRLFFLARDSSGLSKGSYDRGEYMILVSRDFTIFFSVFSLV